HDYHYGADFAQVGGPRQRLDYLKVLDGSDAGRYAAIAFQGRTPPDFSGFSRFQSRRAGAYTFDLDALLNSASKAA
ncbi:MAG TPA: hypothetical protein VJU59_31480, partial [Paraburkholderia sp.]|nr:hypothetical protein [Paraburkholderia sp.]